MQSLYQMMPDDPEKRYPFRKLRPRHDDDDDDDDMILTLTPSSLAFLSTLSFSTTNFCSSNSKSDKRLLFSAATTYQIF